MARMSRGMCRRGAALLVASVACSAAGAAWAQGAPPPGPPMLYLGASGEARVAPDELVADMVALATAAAPAVAQRRVNALMAGAGAAVKPVAGVHAAFLDYAVTLTDAKQPRWTAQQTLELRTEAADRADALLDLVGRLQADGLAVGSLGWRVSAARQAQALDAATEAALAALRRRADLAARALGMSVDRVQDVRINQGPMPMPMLRRMNLAMSASAAMPAPNISPEAQEIAAEVSADIVLRPAR